MMKSDDAGRLTVEGTSKDWHDAAEGQGSIPPPFEIRDAIRVALGSVLDPCSVAVGIPLSITEMDLVERVQFNHHGIVVWIRLTEPTCVFSFYIAHAVERVITG